MTEATGVLGERIRDGMRDLADMQRSPQAKRHDCSAFDVPALGASG